jgi:DNA repair exonuclease SbcCD nuclease subunit
LTKIIHTADTHLGYRQYNNGTRKQDFFDAFDRVVEDAIKNEVDAVIHAGDLFDMRNPSLPDVMKTSNIIQKLKDHDIPFLGIVGNHESKQDNQWLDLYERMGIATRLTANPYYVNDVAIYGIDYIPKTKMDDFDFSKIEPPKDETYHTILAMHQLAAHVPYGTFNCKAMIDALPFKLDAFVLGDYHKYTFTDIEDVKVTYSGSTERHASSESDSRTYNLIETSSDGLNFTRKHIPTREFVYINADLDENINDPQSVVFERIREHKSKIEDSVVILNISGKSDATLSHADIDEYILEQNAIVSKINDKRIMDQYDFADAEQIIFMEPNEAVNTKLNTIELTIGGNQIDQIIRDPSIVKTKVEFEVEEKTVEYLESLDFSSPIPKPERTFIQPKTEDETLEENEEQSIDENPKHEDENSNSSLTTFADFL